LYGPAHANKNFLIPAGASLVGLLYGLVVSHGEMVCG
jgi:hypothetical protein